MESILTALTNFGIGGLFAAAILWFVWYRETKTIPLLLDSFGKQIDKLIENAKEDRKANSHEHDEIMRAVRDVHATMGRNGVGRAE